jgi:hypothetical protein
MIHLTKKTLLGISIAVMSGSFADAMNLTKPYDSLLKPLPPAQNRFQLGVLGEKGFNTTGFDAVNSCVNVLQIWNPNQDAIAMLSGFPDNSPISQLLNIIGTLDDGVSGHFQTCGTLKVDSSASVWASYGLPNNLTISAYLPFYSMSLNNVVLQDMTPATNLVIRNNLTNNIAALVQELGGLSLNPWKRRGVGDLVLMLDWDRDFPQAKPFLKNVHINGRIGVNIPTGVKEDVDKLLALPFGFNGATGLIVGAGLDLTFANVLRGGMHVDLIQLFGFTRCARIKTDLNQTDLFLLGKAALYEDFGMFQWLNLYIEFYKFYQGLSLKGAYQFMKQGENKVTLATNDFSSSVANTAEKLQESTMHNALIQITYDFAENLCEDALVVPSISVYYKRPFNGRRSVMTDGLGVIFSVNF